MVDENSDDGDVWADSSDDGQPGVGHRELDREAAARHQQFYNAGYRDALDEGKERTLQQGFDIGFREGAAAGFEWGLLRGAAATLAALDGQAAGTRQLHQQIVALQAAADVAPRAAMLGTFRHVLSAPMPLPPHQQQRPQTRPQEAQQAEQPAERVEPGSSSGGGDTAGIGPGTGGAGAAGLEDALQALGMADAGPGPSGGVPADVDPDPPLAPPPYVLPPDAAAMALPDMPTLMADLRERLRDMGFDVGHAPPPPPAALSSPQRQPAQQEKE